MKRNKISGYIPSPEDSRDYKLSRLIKCSPKLPSSYITKRKNIHVFDQDDSNMCVSCAIAAFKQIIEKSDEEFVAEGVYESTALFMHFTLLADLGYDT